jgi:hypothetical protein
MTADLPGSVLVGRKKFGLFVVVKVSRLERQEKPKP